MPKRIRTVAQLDTSNQTALFGAAAVPVRVESAMAAARPAVRFEELDPRAIRINEVPLEQWLRSSGQRAPLALRALFERLSFAEFDSAYAAGGRPPYAPRAMLGIVLSGILQGITSLRELERYARLDVGCWWISGGIMPDHSVLGRFIQRHEALLTETFFEQLTRQVLQATGSGTAVVAGDGTIIEAAASRYRLIKAEALREALAAARASQTDQHHEPPGGGTAASPQAATAPPAAPTSQHPQRQAALSTHIAQLEAAERMLHERKQAREDHGRDATFMRIHPQEPEAVVQPQKDKASHRASYKPSVLVNTARVIVAQAVHPSSETAVLPQLIESTQAQGRIETALFDAGYFAADTLRLTAERNIELLCPHGQPQGEDWEKTCAKFFPKHHFIYDPESDTYRCPNGETLKPIERYAGNAQQLPYVQYGTEACKECPLASACTRSTQGRTIKRYECDDAKDALRAKMRDPQVRERYRKRSAIVEPVFAQLRGGQQLNRFRRKGLKNVRVEFALHAMAYNLGRAVIVKLLVFINAWLRLCRAGTRVHQPALARAFNIVPLRTLRGVAQTMLNAH